MRIINKDQLMQMPTGTIYCKYDEANPDHGMQGPYMRINNDGGNSYAEKEYSDDQSFAILDKDDIQAIIKLQVAADQPPKHHVVIMVEKEGELT